MYTVSGDNTKSTGKKKTASPIHDKWGIIYIWNVWSDPEHQALSYWKKGKEKPKAMRILDAIGLVLLCKM